MKRQHVTKKQLEILLLLYRFRFLNRPQIQELLDHKTSHRIKTWLTELTNREIIGRYYSENSRDNTLPAIYYLKPLSRHILIGHLGSTNQHLESLYEEKKRSLYFQEKSLLLANIYLLLKQTTDGEIHFYTKRDLEEHTYLYKPLPAAYFALTEKEQINRYFLEIIDKNEFLPATKKHLNNLFNYYDSGDWERVTNHAFPKFLVICPNNRIKTSLAKYIKSHRDLEKDPPTFYLTTVEEIKSKFLIPNQ